MKLLMIFFVILCSGCASVSQKGRNKASYDGFLVRENGMPVAKAMVALQENRETGSETGKRGQGGNWGNGVRVVIVTASAFG